MQLALVAFFQKVLEPFERKPLYIFSLLELEISSKTDRFCTETSFTCLLSRRLSLLKHFLLSSFISIVPSVMDILSLIPCW